MKTSHYSLSKVQIEGQTEFSIYHEGDKGWWWRTEHGRIRNRKETPYFISPNGAKWLGVERQTTL